MLKGEKNAVAAQQEQVQKGEQLSDVLLCSFEGLSDDDISFVRLLSFLSSKLSAQGTKLTASTAMDNMKEINFTCCKNKGFCCKFGN